jgi:hypothetical protein
MIYVSTIIIALVSLKVCISSPFWFKFLAIQKELFHHEKGDMMSIIKIMPCLDMKEGRVVKGIHFVDLKDAGDPVENAAFYQKEGADELAMLDIAATVENRKTRLEWVKNVSSVITIPLTVGGGSRLELIKSP